MLRLVRAQRRFSSSLMHSCTTPHNESNPNTQVTPMMYDKEGNVTPRSWLVLHTQEEIEKYVLNLFKNYFRTTNKGHLSADSVFKDHGLDSLDAVELVVRMEDELGYVVPGEALRCFSSIRSFVNYIKQTEDFKREFNKEPIN
mmetsp:Transcript_4399/g.6629  ORF Transcript_4399/g.6629 Transcript_4399/m.6629 type:complete len:143 (+) Transcript_4399:59-487(+)